MCSGDSWAEDFDQQQLLTTKEKRAIELTGEAASLIFEIIEENGGFENDAHEIAQACHVLQRFVMSSAAARAYPGKFRKLGVSPTEPKQIPTNHIRVVQQVRAGE